MLLQDERGSAGSYFLVEFLLHLLFRLLQCGIQVLDLKPSGTVRQCLVSRRRISVPNQTGIAALRS